MAVIKLVPKKDTNINSYFDVNKGIDEILEVGVDYSTQAISRVLIAFDANEISNLKTLYTGSTQNLNLFLATANTIPSIYTLELYQILDSNWNNGIGNSTQDDPNGIRWSTYMSTYDLSKIKLTEQTYSIYDDKDISLNVSGSTTYSYLLKLQNDINLSTGSNFNINYYSKDTNTIFSPNIDFKFIDSVYNNSLSGSVITKDAFTVSLKNNCSQMYNNSIYRINIGTRYTYPERTFFKNSIFSQKKFLPSTSYYAIRDVHANHTIIDFDTTYTKISLDTNGNFFNLYTKNFETNRYYSVDIKVVLNGNEHILKDTYIFKLHDK